MSKSDWREIPYSKAFEINRDGVIRDSRTKKVRTAKTPLGYTTGDGKRNSKSIWHVMKDVWPEIVS